MSDTWEEGGGKREEGRWKMRRNVDLHRTLQSCDAVNDGSDALYMMLFTLYPVPCTVDTGHWTDDMLLRVAGLTVTAIMSGCVNQANPIPVSGQCHGYSVVVTAHWSLLTAHTSSLLTKWRHRAKSLLSLSDRIAYSVPNTTMFHLAL